MFDNFQRSKSVIKLIKLSCGEVRGNSRLSKKLKQGADTWTDPDFTSQTNHDSVYLLRNSNNTLLGFLFY